MATITPTITRLGGTKFSVMKFTWTFTATADVGAPIPAAFCEWADRTVQMSGTWNGSTVLWEGSNNVGATYLPLVDRQGSAISKTADAIEAVTEITELARPRASAGTPTAVVISVIARRPN